MSWKISDEALSTKIVLNDCTSMLKQWMDKRKFSCDLKVNVAAHDPYFWLTKDERMGLKGPIGAYGPCGPLGAHREAQIDERPIREDKEVIIDISFIMSNVRAIEICQVKLPITVNSLGEHVKTWSNYKCHRSYKFPCGIYAKEGFYEAYEAIKILNPYLTPEEFAFDSKNECWDEDMVITKMYTGPEKCLKIISNAEDSVETGESCVTLKLLMCDIESSLNYITTILTPFCL